MPTAQTISLFQKKFVSKAMILGICLSLGFILAGFKPIGKGLILGTLFSAANFILMGLGLSLQISASRRSTFFRSLSSIGLRYALMAVPLLLAIRMPIFNFAAVVVGLFMVQIIVVFENLRGRRSPSRQDRV